MDIIYKKVDFHNILLLNEYSKNIKFDSTLPVMLVDDNIIMRKLIARLLNVVGIPNDRLTVVSSGEECIKLLQNNQYSVIFTDINMPIMNGYEMSIEARKNGFNGLLIAISGMIGDIEYEKAYKAGINYFHTKPINTDLLKKLLKEYNIV